jgi:hypothetical protein
VGDIVMLTGLGFHQFTYDTQIHFAMHSATMGQQLSIITEHLHDWFFSNELMLIPVLKVRSFIYWKASQTVTAVATINSISVVDLPISSEL